MPRARPRGAIRRGRSRTARRRRELRALVMELARQDFRRRHGDVRFDPVLILIASYLEADNIGDVLKAVPERIAGLQVSTLVVVDGGDDGTEDVVADHGAFAAVLPVNMGQGVALRVGYDLADACGARYVVTVDADGQNDPAEAPELLAPVLADEADFVVASRRLGRDDTTDPVRRAGVVFFAWVVDHLIGKRLTDTSNGFRALRTEVLRDVTLEQDQYQTAELIIAAASRGWRIAERPTIWHPRASGESKKGHNVFFALNYARVILTTWLRERRSSR
ncbi:MAG TPA: glycosyltransferase family 2 protein [Acidimicrobiales bacterium]|nr:glycosyltransferase family 2 protein [Acidimicrobiales bacterium]